jgi:hypothetical protein
MSRIEQLAKTGEQKQQPARGFDSYGLLACILISAFLIVWITLASKSLNFGTVVFLFALPWVLLRAGAIVTAALRFPSFFALDFLLGVTGVSVAVMTWKFLLPVSLWVLLIVLLVAVASVPKLLSRHRRDPLSALGLLSVIVSLVAATAWSQDLIWPNSAVKDGVVFKPGADFFFHATIVARSLGTQTLIQVGNYEWQGFPAIFYHYASYSLASCLAKVGHVSAYVTVVGFWAPFGSFLTGLASYALARAVWSQGAGLAALMATSLIPDAWLLNIAHPIYGYFWLQEISPAGLYGVAIAGAALTLIAMGAREGRRAWMASGVVAGALVLFFKVQIFAAAFPLLFGFAVLTWPHGRGSHGPVGRPPMKAALTGVPATGWWLRRGMRWVILGTCVAAGITLLPVANRSYIGPNMRFDFSASDWYWKILADLARGTAVEGWYAPFRDGHAFPSHLAQAIGLLLVSALGIFAILAPLVWIVALWRKNWQASDGISLAGVAILLLMTFGLSRSGTAENAYEFMQRPFVWTYWLVGALTAGRLFSMVTERYLRFATAIVIVSIAALMLVPARYGSGLQPGKWPGGKANCNLRLDRGLVDCAHYIRSQAPTNALAQDSHLEKFAILGGLSERPSFAARLNVWTRASQAFRRSPYREQLRKLENLQRATSIPDLQRSVRETGIRWYVAHPGDPSVWPAEFRDHPAFESNGYRVYDMSRCFELPARSSPPQNT